MASQTANRLILALVGLPLGLIVGFVLNALRYLFLSLVLDWRDSAPDWYFPIQGHRPDVDLGRVVSSLPVGESGRLCSGEDAGKGMSMDRAKG